MNKQLITIVDNDGTSKQVELVGLFPSEREEKLYIVYSDGQSEKEDMVNIYFAIVNENENGLSLNAINNDEEFKYVQELVTKQLNEVK